jgi:hypothetical protein
MKFVKYFLQKRSVTILLLLLVLGGGLLSYVKMGKLEVLMCSTGSELWEQALRAWAN